jgi:hypothetical protein
MKWFATRLYKFLYWVMNDIAPEEFTQTDRIKLDKIYNRIINK